MRPASLPTRARHRAASLARTAGWLSGRLAEGISPGFVAALAALVLVAILLTVATRDAKKATGYAEFTMFPKGCAVDPGRRLHARTCQQVSPGVYRVHFSQSLDGSTALVSRGTCCPGRISASLDTNRAVLVAIERRVRRPVRASVLVP